MIITVKNNRMITDTTGVIPRLFIPITAFGALKTVTLSRHRYLHAPVIISLKNQRPRYFYMSDRTDRIRQRSSQDNTERSDTLFTVLTSVGILLHTILLIAGLIYVPILAAYISTSSTPFMLAVFAATMGFIPVYVLRYRVKPGILATISVIDSLLIGIFMGLGHIQYTAFQQLQQFEQELTTGSSSMNGTSSLDAGSTLSGGQYNIEVAIHPDIAFVTLFTLFNAPFLYYLWKQDVLHWKLLAVYLLPIIIYWVTPLLFGNLIASHLL